MNAQLFNQIPYAARKFSVSAAINSAKPNSLIDSIIRVNHAGELGADRIYAGQMAILGGTKVGPVIQHMWDQEKVHKATFEKLIVKYRVRPTALTPIWNVAGFILGAGTALLGEKAAMACTVAVESVIVDHYNDQLRTLMDDPEKNKELLETIQKFRDEEQEHHDFGVDHGAEQAPFYTVLSEVIKFGCKQAIAISKGLLSPHPNRFNFFTSRNYGTTSNSNSNLKWDLYSAVCLERKPVVLKPLTGIEKKVLKTLTEIEEEKSYKSDFELKSEADLRKTELIKSGAPLKNIDLDLVVKDTVQDLQESWERELANFMESAPGAKKSDGKNDDLRSPNRKLTSHLSLLVKEKMGDQKRWIFPHGIRREPETMRETAERILKEKCGNGLKAWFLGNSPCGFYKFKYPASARGEVVGGKIFFFKAIYAGGMVDSKMVGSDFQWATRGELKKLLNNENYHKKVSMFLIEDGDEAEEEETNRLR